MGKIKLFMSCHVYNIITKLYIYFVKLLANLKCHCSHCPEYSINNTCETGIGGFCFTSVKPVIDDIGHVVPETEYGCFPPDVEGMLQVCYYFKIFSYLN